MTGQNELKQDNHLERGLSLTQATAINMIDMVGIGPFVTIPLIVSAFQGPMSILAWLLGALLAYMDGMVWAEMGAKWPQAGGSYVFLQKLFGKGGKLMAFLFIWQTIIQAPLVAASGAIGFSQYLTYLIPLDTMQQKMVSGGLVILLVVLLYRNIQSIGKLSIVLSVITIGTILWLVVAGLPKFSAAQAFDWHSSASSSISPLFFTVLAQASLKSVYSYLGYYNVCHLGAEIKDPERNIPRSIFISITGIAILYLSMQTVLLGVLPWQQIAGSEFIISTYFEHIYNHTAGQIATVLVLCIAIASLFSVLLGYSRVPYAAAQNGDFFEIFGRVHSKHKFPHVSLLAIGGLAFIFSLLFKMKEVITAIITMRILIQFVSQAVGVIAWHINKPAEHRPFKMPLFPIPAIISIIIWLFILVLSDILFIAIALGIIVTGIILYFIKQAYTK
ncbi:MAG: amino acid permease [Sphingobacteriales bacterium]|nr:MAG: amino acid permease [Sphingobacteriales bacterium]